MTKYGKIILLLYICIAIAIVCVVVLNYVGKDECTNLPVPSFLSAVKSINNYKYPNKQTRIAMASIAEYIVHTNETLKDLEVSSMTDYAIHSIVTTPIKTINVKRIRVFNDPRYVQAIEGYDLMAGRFKSVGDKEFAISVCKQYYDDPAKPEVSNLYASMTEPEIFEMLAQPADNTTAVAPGTPIVDTRPSVPTTPPVIVPPIAPPTVPTPSAIPDENKSPVVSTRTLDDGTVITFYSDGTNRMVSKDNSVIVTDAKGQITVYPPT